MKNCWIDLLLICGVALLLRVTLLALRPFDGLYGQDAFAYYEYALALRSALLHGQPLPAFFWPIGFPLHLVMAQNIGGVSPQAAQLVSVMAGALVAPLTYLLAREALIDRAPARARVGALVAGLIVAVSGQLLISSLSIMSDATALLWATTSAWCVMRYARTLKARWFIAAVLTLAIAVITRWMMALLVVPWISAVLLVWYKHWPQIGWRRAALLIASAALIGGIIVGGQLLSGSHTGDLSVVGWHPSNAVQRDVVNSDGVFRYDWPMAVYYAQPVAHPAYVFPLLLPFLLIGLWSLRKSSPAVMVVLIGWPLLAYVFLSSIAWQNPRFMLAYLPPLAVWAGLGSAALWGRVDRSGWRWALSAYVAVALIGTVWWSSRVTINFITRNKEADLQRVAYVTAHVPHDATVLSFGLTATLEQYTALRVIELFHETPESLAARLHQGALYIMVDEANIATQWAGKSPQINLTWLKTQEVHELGSLPPYTLLRVEGRP